MKQRKLRLRMSSRRKSFKMNSLDDSVVVCDTPKINKPSQKINKSSRNTSTSPPIRQTRSKRKPLYPVQTSPINCRNMCLNKSQQSMIKKKRSREIEILPSRKKQKTSINETIVISDDDDDGDVDDDDNNGVNHGLQMPNKLKDTPEIIVIDNSNRSDHNTRLQFCKSNVNNPEKKRKKIIEDKILERKKLRKIQIMERTRNRARKNTEGKEKNDEDVAIIWSSAKEDNAAAKKNQATITENNNKTQELFFVDTKGDDSNLNKMVLLSPSEILYTTNTFAKFNTVPTTSSTTKVTPEQVKNNNSGKPTNDQSNKTISKLREIIVDGLNVAFGYSLGKKVFEKNGLQLVLDYFQDRGHKVKIFLPQIHRNRNRNFLEQWYREGLVIFTPSRNVGGKKIVPYDDRFILEYATKCKGIVVSSDQYRDLWQEKPEWRETIEKRLLAPTFVGEYVMFPEDPLGRGGPSLHEFLRH